MTKTIFRHLHGSKSGCKVRKQCLKSIKLRKQSCDRIGIQKDRSERKERKLMNKQQSCTVHDEQQSFSLRCISMSFEKKVDVEDKMNLQRGGNFFLEKIG